MRRPGTHRGASPGSPRLPPSEAVNLLLRRALEQYAGKEAGAFLDESWERPAARKRGTATTRAARHARARRARSLAVAAAYLFVCERPELMPLLLEPAFASLRPGSAQTFSRVVHLAARDPPTRLPAFWEHLADEWLALAASSDLTTATGALRSESALAGLQVAARLGRSALRAGWHSLWTTARKRALLDSPYVRMRLSALGIWVGEPDEHVGWLMAPRTRWFELADALRFVRTDGSPHISTAVVRSVRTSSQELPSWSADVLSQPPGAWRRLAEHVRGCLRASWQFDNAGLALMILGRADAIRLHVNAYGHLLPPRAHALLVRDIGKIEVVQRIERRRFHSLLERLPTTGVSELLRELWR